MTEIDPCNYGGQEALPPAVCKLENRKASGIIQAESKAENQRSQGKKVGEDGCPSSGREQIRPSSTLLSYSGPHRLDDAHPHWGRQSTLFNLPIQMLISY